MSDNPVIRWNEAGEEKSARWRSESGMPPPKRVVIADDRMTADARAPPCCGGVIFRTRANCCRP